MSELGQYVLLLLLLLSSVTATSYVTVKTLDLEGLAIHDIQNVTVQMEFENASGTAVFSE